MTIHSDATTQAAFRVDKKLVRDFDEYAKKNFRTRSDQLRSLMVDWVKEQKSEEYKQREIEGE